MSAREKGLAVAVAVASFAVVSTEALSLVGAFNRSGLLLAWATLAAATIVLSRGRHIAAHPVPASRAPRRPADAVELLLLVAVGAVLGCIWLTAASSAPNTFDSMTYHMSRIAHWHRNQGVFFYATNIPRQLYQLPGAEYLVAQLYVLFGGDRVVNMVQWCALAGSVVGVSAIARWLGATRRGQLRAVLACATLPMAVLQGSSTQNDLVATLWIVCTILFGIRLADGWSLPSAVLTGASLGLALLTKATAALFIAPFALSIPVAAYRARGRRPWLAVAVVVSIAVLFCLPHLVRTQRIFGHPLGPLHEAGGQYGYLVDGVSPATITSGALRSFGLQAAGPSRTINDWLETSIVRAHRALGIDPDDPKTTWGGLTFAIGDAARDEDAAGNPQHLLLLAAIGVGLAVDPRMRRRRLLYAAALMGGFLLFSTVLKWMPWHGRLHLPLLVIAMPLAGIRLPARHSAPITVAAAIILTLVAGPQLLYNQRRPLLPPGSVLQTSRAEQYFAGNPGVEHAYRDALRLLETDVRCAEVGLALGPDDYEYPLWALPANAGGRPIRFEHVGVNNPSSRLQDPSFAPCAVLMSAWRGAARMSISGVAFEAAYDLGALRLLIPATRRRPPASR